MGSGTSGRAIVTTHQYLSLFIVWRSRGYGNGRSYNPMNLKFNQFAAFLVSQCLHIKFT